MRHISKILSVILFSLLPILSFGQKVTVDYNAKQQQINMIGSDLERSAGFVQQAADPEEVLQWCFGDIPYVACRVAYDKKQELVEGEKNMAFYDNMLATMKMMRVINPDIDFYATLKSDYNGYGGTNNLPEWICDDRPNTFFNIDKYVGFLADYLELLNDNGVAATYMTVSKEWKQTITEERTVDIIDGLLVELPKRGVPIPKFTDPSAWAVYQATTFVNNIVKMNAQDRFYAFSTHNYNNSAGSYPGFIAACKTAGKYAWNDESGYGNGGRTNGEEPATIDAILGSYTTRADYYKQGLEGELFFEITSRGVNSETRAVYFTSGSEAKRLRSYYVGKMFAENVYERYYATSTMASLNSDVSTMAFVNDDEVALWIVNNSSTNYPAVELDFDNVNISGDVMQYAHTTEKKIYGDLTVLSETSGSYTAAIAPNSVNYIEVKIRNQVADPDVIILEQDEIDFGVVASNDLKDVEQILYVRVDNPSSAVTVDVSGSHAVAFSIDENASIPVAPQVWYIPVKFSFKPTYAGQFEATVNVTSGAEKQSIPIKGEVYLAETVQMPFVDLFPNLVASSVLDNSVINSFTTYKGWTVAHGKSSGNDRMQIVSTGNPDAHISTPEIIISGPFQLTFYARMLLNGIGDASSGERDENDLARNFYAILDGDTIYDHHKTGSKAFQNYNKWTCTYDYQGTAKIKFVAEVGTEGVWEETIDGLTFGPKSDAVRVQSTTLPAINVAYGHHLDFGQVPMNTLNDLKYTITGSNLSEDLYLSTEVGSRITPSHSQIYQSNGSLSQEVTFRLNTDGMIAGDYTSVVNLKGENTQIKDRTITFTYQVVDPASIGDVDELDSIVTGERGGIQVDVVNKSISIYNMSGVKVRSAHVLGKKYFSLPVGVYLVEVEGATKKVVVY